MDFRPSKASEQRSKLKNIHEVDEKVSESSNSYNPG
jgi:hypothetical protein